MADDRDFPYEWSNPKEEKVLTIEELVKQEAIAFAKFAMDKTFQDLNNDDKWVLDDFSEVTDEQLYQLFIESQSKPTTNGFDY